MLTPGNPDVVAVTGGVDDFKWRYDAQTLAMSVAPADWNTLTGAAACGTGATTEMQSPINIVANDAVAATTDIGAVTTTLFDTDITGALVNTGRVARWIATGNAKPTISGGPLGSNRV